MRRFILFVFLIRLDVVAGSSGFTGSGVYTDDLCLIYDYASILAFPETVRGRLCADSDAFKVSTLRSASLLRLASRDGLFG